MYCLTESNGKNSFTDKDSAFPSFAEYALYDSKAEKIAGLHRAVASSSGSIIDSTGLVLTVAHAVETGESAKIIYRNRVKKAFVVFRDEKLDIMLLRFDPKDFSDIPYLELSFEAVNLGQKVYGVSFPHADQTNAHPIYYNCDITSVENQNKPHLIQINNELSKGCSGMCVVNDSGRIVGVVNSQSNGIVFPKDWNFATSTRYFKERIKRYLPKEIHKPSTRLCSELLAQKLTRTAVLVLACDRR
jgi:S1-C subfamily serine protease